MGSDQFSQPKRSRNVDGLYRLIVELTEPDIKRLEHWGLDQQSIVANVQNNSPPILYSQAILGRKLSTSTEETCASSGYCSENGRCLSASPPLSEDLPMKEIDELPNMKNSAWGNMNNTWKMPINRSTSQLSVRSAASCLTRSVTPTTQNSNPGILPDLLRNILNNSYQYCGSSSIVLANAISKTLNSSNADSRFPPSLHAKHGWVVIVGGQQTCVYVHSCLERSQFRTELGDSAYKIVLIKLLPEGTCLNARQTITPLLTIARTIQAQLEHLIKEVLTIFQKKFGPAFKYSYDLVSHIQLKIFEKITKEFVCKDYILDSRGKETTRQRVNALHWYIVVSKVPQDTSKAVVVHFPATYQEENVKFLTKVEFDGFTVIVWTDYLKDEEANPYIR